MHISSSNSLALAWRDIIQGFVQWRVWVSLAWQDIRLRYRRSHLGPLWITISIAVTILGMAFLYGYLFKISIRYYLPYLASGMVIWTFYASFMTEGTQIFLEAEGYLKQIKLPYTGLVLRVLIRSFIVFAHNAIILFPILFLLKFPLTSALLLWIPALLLTALMGFVFMFLLAIVGARYRDIGPIVNSLVQVIFFITPVMWEAKSLPENYRFFVDYNPFAQFISLLRAPLLGQFPAMHAWLIAMVTIFVGLLLTFYFLVTLRKRFIYWV